MKEAISIITGDKTLGYYLAGFFFAGLAILLSLYVSSKKRDPLSPNTPYHFSWLFLIWDNAKRAVSTLVAMFILFRMFDLHSIYLSLGVGFAVSFMLDQIISLMMKSSDVICNLLSMDRDKFMTNANEKNNPPPNG